MIREQGKYRHAMEIPNELVYADPGNQAREAGIASGTDDFGGFPEVVESETG